ncbi:conjugal transfer protein, partial [Bacillus wiedmannii]|nr:conjugal transfer protein [Bacillus wiedmannii]
QILKKINDGSAAIQSEVLSASASIVNPGTGYNQKEGIATVRNQMFDLMIKKPYLLMQYGVVEEEEIKKEDKERVDNLLALDPNLKGEEREKIAEKEVKDYKNEMMGLNGIKLRAGMVPLVFIADIIIGILVLLLSCTMIFYQILFLI